MPETSGLWFEEHGDRNAPPLILSSGLGGAGGYWKPNLRALSEHFRVITYDQRGTGASDRSPLDDVSVEAMARDVLLLMDALDLEKTHFVGHALGGAIGIECAITTGRIDRLVVVNGWRTLSAHTRRCFAARLALLHGAGIDAFLEAQPLFLFPPDWIASHDEQLKAELAHHRASFPGIETMTQRIEAVQAYAPDPVGLAALAHLLVIATRDDFLVPYVSALDLAGLVPHAKIDSFAWGGHACNVTDPALFNRYVLDFLRS